MNKYELAIDAIRKNYPDERYSMLREGLDTALEVLENKDKNLNEAIDFFTSEDEFDKKELISDWVDEIKEIKGNSADEIGLECDGETLMTLDDFAPQFYEKIINGVCNVLKSFKTE
jgi:hypothetical protein